MILNVNVKLKKITTRVVTSFLLATTLPLKAVELSGYVAGEFRYFQHESSFPEPEKYDPSLVFAPEFYHEWDDGQQSLLFSLFLSFDQQDAERTHADIRELQWIYIEDDWELRLGVSKVFWGVTESQHLVDVINQTDLVENSDTEDKLGQPMINLSLFKDWGTFDLFVMPYFRERTFAGKDGRLRSALVVDTDKATYESDAARQHVDVAVRWSHAIGDWDIGLSHFYGTNREPLLQPNVTFDALIPYYELMNQTGLDIQQTTEAWLWKLEVIRRATRSDTFTALTGGFEYTFYGAFETPMDMGVIVEYLFDDGNDELQTPFENDLMIATRLTWNNEQSTELLFGIVQDLDSSDRTFNFEASRRIGNRWQVSTEARFFSVRDSDTVIYSFRDDDYIQLEFARYF